MFVVALIFNVTTVSRYKLIDLLNADKVTQTVKVRNLTISVLLFLASLGIIAYSYTLLQHNGLKQIDEEFAMATIETLFVGFLALVVGLVAGIFISQFMMFATAHMFNTTLDSFKFVFSQLR